ncbi:hypothetical protein BaRGS_00021257 [Batillaria attramentaria]|uniref:Uncharacterized protein n=1 Tax=Batillaria attramentaria TaxID=370345 RepID=A0ABD0KL70_9CAEN
MNGKFGSNILGAIRMKGLSGRRIANVRQRDNEHANIKSCAQSPTGGCGGLFACLITCPTCSISAAKVYVTNEGTSGGTARSLSLI